MENTAKIYKSNQSAGCFSSELTLEIDDKKAIIEYRSRSMGGRIHNLIEGDVIVNGKSFKRVYVTKIIRKDVEIYIYDEIRHDYIALDIFTLNEFYPSDDSTGLTGIRCANCPRYNKEFNCAIYLNRNITDYFDQFSDKIQNVIMGIDGKSLSSSSKPQKDGWTWNLNSNNQICTKRITEDTKEIL